MRALRFAIPLLLLASAAQANGWQFYRDPAGLFSLAYPSGWILDTHHVYDALGPGKAIRGVAFKVDPAFAKGTNLSSDSYFALEVMPGPGPCRPDRFMDDAIDKIRSRQGHHGITWLVLDGADAGAGNVYEQTVQTAEGARPCIATRAFAHSTNIGNYDPGTVKPFDRAQFNRTIDRMRNSIRIPAR